MLLVFRHYILSVLHILVCFFENKTFKGYGSVFIGVQRSIKGSPDSIFKGKPIDVN